MNCIWEILVPTETQAGKPIRTRQHREWDRRVQRVTGGLTVLQPVRGQWVSAQGLLVAERMIPVRIACTEPQINEIADMTAAFYDQDAVMFYQISDNVTIKNYR
jgi:hypothetical protein